MLITDVVLKDILVKVLPYNFFLFNTKSVFEFFKKILDIHIFKVK